MYSVALLMALSTSADTPACHRSRGNSCCSTASYSSCYGGYGGCGGYGGYGGCGGYGGYGGYGGCGGYVISSCYGGYTGTYGPAPGETQAEFDFCQEEGKKMTTSDYATFRSAWLQKTSDERKKMMDAKKKGGKDEEVAAPATVVVSLPADAKLMVDDKPTSSTSARRTFVSPELEPGRTYCYTLRAEVMRDGKKMVMEQRIDVAAGKEVKVKFDEGSAQLASR